MAGKTGKKRAAPNALAPEGLLSEYPRKIQMLGNDLRRLLCRAVPTFTDTRRRALIRLIQRAVARQSM